MIILICVITGHGYRVAMLMKRLIKNKLHFKLESCKSPLNHFQFYTFRVQKNGSVDNIPFPKLKFF